MLRAEGLFYAYETGREALLVLKGLSFQINAGQHTVLRGASGCGKSTLLHLAGLLDRPQRGKLWIEGRDTLQLHEAERTHLRRTSIGLIYQFHHLLPELSATENAAFPLVIGGTSWKKALESAETFLKAVGLQKRLQHKPNQLSGGERQRVAIARALIHKPKLLIADEPTGSLDASTGALVMSLIQELLEAQKATLLMATHNPDLIRGGFRVLALKDGLLQED